MKIPVTLNNDYYVFEADPSEKLVDVLRREKLSSVKRGCMSSNCGACYVLLNKRVVPSCQVCVGLVKGSSITTLEYFCKTDIYSDIVKGFEKAGISMCGFCNAGKIFLAYEILTYMIQPTREKIYEVIGSLIDCCVEQDQLINGILYAYSIHYNKEKLRKNGN